MSVDEQEERRETRSLQRGSRSVVGLVALVAAALALFLVGYFTIYGPLMPQPPSNPEVGGGNPAVVEKAQPQKQPTTP